MFNCEKRLLKGIVHIKAGYTLRTKIPEDPNGTISIAQMKDVQPDSGIDWSNLTRMNPVSLREPDYLNQGDIIFCGRGTRIFAVPVTTSPENTVAASQFFVLTPLDDSVSAPYLSWYINSTAAQRYFWTKAAGSSIINVTRSVLEDLQVPIPSQNDLRTIEKMIDSIQIEKRLSAKLTGQRQKMLEMIITKSTEDQ